MHQDDWEILRLKGFSELQIWTHLMMEIHTRLKGRKPLLVRTLLKQPVLGIYCH
jgi:hypothetical protein